MQLSYSKAIAKDVKRIKDRRLLDKVEKIVLELKAADSLYDFRGDIKALSGAPDFYRIRIGDYRLMLKEVDSGVKLLHFRHRKDVYKEFP